MPKESKIVVQAFLDGTSKKMKNTETDGKELRLFGNGIAWHLSETNIGITMAGWGSVTTRDRLNTLFRIAGIDASVYQQNHDQYIRIGAETSPLGTQDVYYFAKG